MRVGVVGMGHVGSSLSTALAAVADVVTWDRAYEQPYPDEAFARCALVAVCVDTPSAEDGSCDTANVVAAVERVPNECIWLRSTVAPGTTAALVARTGKRVVFSPEYHGEPTTLSAGWASDLARVPFLILGGEPAHRTELLDLLVPLLGAEPTYFTCGSLEAEIVKYMENAFLATKVTFANEFERICARFGADWHTVREGWLLDPRVGRSHSAVHAPRGGYAGRCLPKDLSAITEAARLAGYEPTLLVEVARANERIRGERQAPS